MYAKTLTALPMSDRKSNHEILSNKNALKNPHIEFFIFFASNNKFLSCYLFFTLNGSHSFFLNVSVLFIHHYTPTCIHYVILYTHPFNYFILNFISLYTELFIVLRYYHSL